MRGKRHPVFQDSTKLETHSPNCPELDRKEHRGRVGIYDRDDRVEEGEEKSKTHQEKMETPSGVLGIDHVEDELLEPIDP